MDLHTIKTPSLVLDIARVRRNAERMSERVREFGVSLRPHIKTHKCVEVARIPDDTEIPRRLDEAARRAGVTLDLFLKVDCGYHRCGVEPDRPEALEIPRLINDARGLRFAGILTHAGHSYHARSREELLT